MIKKMIAVACGSLVLGAVTVCVNLVQIRKNAKLAKKLYDTYENFSEAQAKDISEVMIRKAVEKAADGKVVEYMSTTKNEVLRTADKNLEIQARNAVEAYSKDIRKQASEKISQQVANLDVDVLKRQVKNEAEKHILEKLDGFLDDSVKQFKDQMDYAKKVHTRYAIAMEETEDEDDNAFKFVLL